MLWTTTDAYKVLIARAQLGESVDLVPATFHVGNGATFDGDGEPVPPSGADSDLANPLSSAPISSLTRSGFTVTAVGVIPGGADPTTINEICMKTASGVMICRATMKPMTFQAPVTYQATLQMQPEY